MIKWHLIIIWLLFDYYSIIIWLFVYKYETFKKFQILDDLGFHLELAAV